MSAVASTPIDQNAKGAPASGRLFFLDLSGGRVLSTNPDGSDLKTLINEGRRLPDGLALDVAGGHIYWTNMGDPNRNDGSIMRSDLSGKNMSRKAEHGRQAQMTNLNFDKQTTALLLIDPYNDFISEGGKLWDRIQAVAVANDCIAHMLQLLTAARTAGIGIVYAMHHRYRPGDYETWKYTAPIQRMAWSRKTFEYGTWGGEFRAEFAPQPGDIVAHEHWCSSGFANTDLDLQLKRHGIQRLIVAGLVAHTCVESTVREAVELGYDVTVVKDATADYAEEFMHAALVTNLPNYAGAIVTTQEVTDAVSGSRPLERSSSAGHGIGARGETPVLPA